MRRKLHGLKIPVAFAAILLASCGTSPGEAPSDEDADTTQVLAATSVPDGRWMVETVDGKPVEEGEFTIETSDSRIVGGYDGCNSWSKVPGEPGMVESTLQGCGKSERMLAYDTVSLGDTAQLSLSDGTLMAEAAGHRLSATPWAEHDQVELKIADYPNLYSSPEERAEPLLPSSAQASPSPGE